MRKRQVSPRAVQQGTDLRCAATCQLYWNEMRILLLRGYVKDTEMHNSITCDTTADAVARIARTGASGGLTGRSDPELRCVSLLVHCLVSMMLMRHEQS